MRLILQIFNHCFLYLNFYFINTMEEKKYKCNRCGFDMNVPFIKLEEEEVHCESCGCKFCNCDKCNCDGCCGEDCKCDCCK